MSKVTRDILKDPRYDLVPLHKRPDLLHQCCKLLNSEWKRSETARLKSLILSSDFLPTCLLLIFDNQVLGHCKVSVVNNMRDSVIIESFVIDHAYRSKGYGSMFLGCVEDYLLDKYNIKHIYLMTKGQEGFYLKNGYTVCEPTRELNHRYRNLGPDPYDSSEEDTKLKAKKDAEKKKTEATTKFNVKQDIQPKAKDTGTGIKNFVEHGCIQRAKMIFEAGAKPKTDIAENQSKTKAKNTSLGPPPPPMPSELGNPPIQICLTISTRTFMKKRIRV